jgi:hypothetical protein
VRRLAAIALAVPALTACGGSSDKQPADPGAAVLAAFIAAAGHGDTKAMRTLLSAQSQTRVSDAALGALAKRLRPFARGNRLVVSERITDSFGVVAAVRQPATFAAAMRLAAGNWKLELGGPIRIRPLGPRPGSRERRVRQVAAAIDNASEGGEALLYLDGQAAPDAKVYRFRDQLSVVSNLPTAVPKGRHSVVVFAGSPSTATARGWTFVVPA